jgi:beta-1,4-mannosyltransferase
VSDASDPVVIVSPSSWSLDEDMQMLLDGIERFAAATAVPALVLFATGLGPGRAAFDTRARRIETARLRIVTGWLAETAYHDLLSIADLGICMHHSTSKLDLPMKLVDFQSAGIPALAFDYGRALREVIEPGTATFSDAGQLAGRLREHLVVLAANRNHARAEGESTGITWDEEWQRCALPVL